MRAHLGKWAGGAIFLPGGRPARLRPDQLVCGRLQQPPQTSRSNPRYPIDPPPCPTLPWRFRRLFRRRISARILLRLTISTPPPRPRRNSPLLLARLPTLAASHRTLLTPAGSFVLSAAVRRFLPYRIFVLSRVTLPVSRTPIPGAAWRGSLSVTR